MDTTRFTWKIKNYFRRKEEHKWLIIQKWFHLQKVTGHISSEKPGFGRK